MPSKFTEAAAGEYAGAVHQYDLWIEYHPDDIRAPYALSYRTGRHRRCASPQPGPHEAPAEHRPDTLSASLRLAAMALAPDGRSR